MARTVGGRAATIFSAGNGLEQADAHHPDLLAAGDQRVDRLLDGARWQSP